MRTIELTQGYTSTVSDKDYSRVSQHKWCANLVHGKWYVMRGYKKENGKWSGQTLHRFVLGLTDPLIKVDHRDGNGLNNQRRNLRIATNTQNVKNQRVGTNNTSGFKGVYWRKQSNTWEAHIRVDKTLKHLGCFSEITDAAKAYNRAAKKYFGRFALLNATQ